MKKIKYLEVIQYMYPCVKLPKRLRELFFTYDELYNMSLVGIDNTKTYKIFKLNDYYYYIEKDFKL